MCHILAIFDVLLLDFGQSYTTFKLLQMYGREVGDTEGSSE